jgi:5-methylcytosine-specific restriction endonuclease McrA
VPNEKHYQLARHRKWRAKVLRKAKHLCSHCIKYGKEVTATHAHHRLPLDQYPELAYDVNNGEALCGACHNREHPEKGKHKKGNRSSQFE